MLTSKVYYPDNLAFQIANAVPISQIKYSTMIKINNEI